jgi:hypothetical protein
VQKKKFFFFSDIIFLAGLRCHAHLQCVVMARAAFQLGCLVCVALCCATEVIINPDLESDSSCQPRDPGVSAMCKTLNSALGDSGASNGSDLSCASGAVEGYDELLVRLADGVHNLTGEYQEY